MNKQEIFDTVLFGLRKQGHASKSGEGHCSYRGKDGAMCAAGLLIKDKHYSPQIEGDMVEDPLVQSVLLESGVSACHIEFVSHLQTAHDHELDEDGMATWEDEMRSIAAAYSLVYTEPTEQA